MEAVFVYVTCKDRKQAFDIGRAIVEGRLAACANVIDGMESIYWWEGKLETAKEAILVLKTRSARLDAVTEKVKATPEYACPIIKAAVKGGNLAKEVQPDLVAAALEAAPEQAPEIKACLLAAGRPLGTAFLRSETSRLRAEKRGQGA